ncbi:IucA/IucC family protein [Streptomyces hoynatensis]|uniref:Iron transporter n=1 Tax=Streptomyces hoynatensis TaxID=1141874 RepID=A0A3A9YNX8_9ACTN|nr:IucA/IucC family protein [Streptomyces hoynatensis]RKN37851.1 iron transporter [Streptomyces hoynatensis]
MNARQADSGRALRHLTGPQHHPHRGPKEQPAGPALVPRQSRHGEPVPPPAAPPEDPPAAAAGPAEHPGTAVADPIEAPDAVAAADAATAENLLRCWVRETGVTRPADGILRLPLPATGTALLIPVHHWSATGWHRFGLPLVDGPGQRPGDRAPVDAVTLAALLVREAAHTVGAGRRVTAEATDLAGRVADSARRTAAFLAHRRADPGPAPHGHAFLDAEQSLLLGHPLHPTPKSREGLAGEDARRCSPELRGTFRLHWFAVDRSILATDSAWRDAHGAPVPAWELTARLAGADLPLPAGTVPLPLHPWQARDLRHRPTVSGLLEAGLLHDLGEHGKPWHPTSSLRTVHQPGAPAMLKLSLGLRVTNSRRENLRKELHRGVEVHRLLSAGLGAAWRAAFPGSPGCDILRDPAWLAVDDTEGRPVPGLDTLLRESPFGPREDAACLAALTAPRPWPGRPAQRLTPRLAELVTALAARTGQPTSAVAAQWLWRYLHAVVAPFLWLDAHAGIALEAHQQNTVVLLDPEGWPSGGRFRDNQGYYFRASHRAALQRRLPGIGERSDTFVSDEVADERFAYYLGLNNVLGLIGAFGAARLTEEEKLLATLRRFLTGQAAAADGGPVSSLVPRLLHAPTLRCKANLLTRLHGLDELVGPVDGQSVYVTIPNPLAR